MPLLRQFRRRPANRRAGRLGLARIERGEPAGGFVADADLRARWLETEPLLPPENGDEGAPKLANERIWLAHGLVDQGIAEKSPVVPRVAAEGRFHRRRGG